MAGKRKKEARRWFQQAQYDLKACEWNIQGGFCDTASFLAQQASEKALKSLFYYFGARRQALMTHSLFVMVKEGEKRLPELTALGEEARQLDLHYIPARYPNGLPDGYPHQFYDQATATTALEAAQKILAVIRNYYQTQGEEGILNSDESQD